MINLLLNLIKSIRAQHVLKLKISYKWLIGLSPIYLVVTIWYIISLGFEPQYDVKRGSLMWYTVMDNDFINTFPIVSLDGEVQYNTIGGDSPNIGAGWELNYESKKSISELEILLKDHFVASGSLLQQVDVSNCSWHSSDNNDKKKLFSTKKGCADLLLTITENGNVRVEVLVLI